MTSSMRGLIERADDVRKKRGNCQAGSVGLEAGDAVAGHVSEVGEDRWIAKGISFALIGTGLPARWRAAG